MKLLICEKPDQARSIAAILGVPTKKGALYFSGNGVTISWAFGHILSMYMPDDYSNEYKQWSIGQLPIIPEQWRFSVSKKAFAQYKQLEELVKKANIVGIATDFDREGEAIARSLLDRFHYKNEIIRYPITALDDHSLKRALENPLSSQETISLYFAQIARSRADWLVGMNLSRLFTCLSREVGYREVINIGRVITPMVGLVVERDLAIANFVSRPYWELNVTVDVQKGQFQAHWKVPDSISDETGKCTNTAYIQTIIGQLKLNRKGVVTKSESKQHYENAPLPFDLTSLQQYCIKKFDYSAAKVLEITQSLYEKHHAVTYPRADNRYLPESMHAECTSVFKALILSDRSISSAISGADATIKSRAFDTSKVKAHHAIIPTQAKVDISKLTTDELNVYQAIRTFYIAQFYDPFVFLRNVIEVEVNKEIFTAVGKQPLKSGWKVLINHEYEVFDINQDEQDDNEQILPQVITGEPALISSGNVDEKKTKAPPHFTEATLLGAMEHVERYVDEPKFKSILREKSGLGTVTTRASSIEKAIAASFLVLDKKRIISTDKARTIHQILPMAIKSPGMTAAWEIELEKITDGQLTLNAFMSSITDWLSKLIYQLQHHEKELTSPESGFAKAFALIKPPTHDCMKCGAPLQKRNGSNGIFWSCTSETCNKTYQDEKGKPVNQEDKFCPKCNSKMFVRKGIKPGNKRATKFLGCSGYPNCKHTEPFK